MVRAAAVLAAGVLATVLFLALRPDEETAGRPNEATATAPSPETASDETRTSAKAAAPPVTRIAIEVRGGRPVGGVTRVAVERGGRIDLVVSGDVADEVHVHGHDVSRALAPGRPARIRFRATIPGRIEAELEDAHVLLLELSVRP